MDLYGSNNPRPEMTAEQKRLAELAKGVKDNPYLGYTREGTPGHKPRPTRDDPRFSRDRDDRRLREAQAAWDRAEEWAKENDRLREARLAKRAEEREARQRERDEADARQRAAARADLEERLRRQFLQTPGATLEDWERNKQAVIDDHLRAAALANDEAARRRSAAMYGDW